jgi:hypothetical protein
MGKHRETVSGHGVTMDKRVRAKNRNKDDETPEPAPAEDPYAAFDAWLKRADAVEQARSIDSPVNVVDTTVNAVDTTVNVVDTTVNVVDTTVNAVDTTVNVVDPKKLSTTTNVVVGDRSPTTAPLPRAGRPSAYAPAT